jgi:hypothetical protein
VGTDMATLMQESAPDQPLIEVAYFTATFEGQMVRKRLEYENKDWIDVVRKAIKDSRDEDDADHADVNEDPKIECGEPIYPAAAYVNLSLTQTRSRSSSAATDNFGDSEAQNFGGLSLTEARNLLRDCFSIPKGLVIKLFDPMSGLEVRSKADFVQCFEDWAKSDSIRKRNFYCAAANSILSQLVSYEQFSSVGDYVEAKRTESGSVKRALSDEEQWKERKRQELEVLESAAVETNQVKQAMYGSDGDDEAQFEDHDAVLRTIKHLAHLMDVMKIQQDLAGLAIMPEASWKTFLQRCWHHLMRCCRSANYFVATEAALMLATRHEFVTFSKPSKHSPEGHIAFGTAFLVALVRHSETGAKSGDASRLSGALKGLWLTSFHDAEDFFRHCRPYSASMAAHALIGLLGTCESKKAAQLLACCLRLAKPDELCKTIKEMIDRPEQESYLLGLRLILTMATSAVGRTTLWSEIDLLDRAITIGTNKFKLRAARFESIYIDHDPLLVRGLDDSEKNQGKKAAGHDGSGSGQRAMASEKSKYSRDHENAHDLLTFQRVSQAILMYIRSASSSEMLKVDVARRQLFALAVPLLVNLAKVTDDTAVTAQSACGALARLAGAGLVSFSAVNVLLRLVELPAALGVTQKASVALCNIVRSHAPGSNSIAFGLMRRCADTITMRAKHCCENNVQTYIARAMLFLAQAIKPSVSGTPGHITDCAGASMIAIAAILSPLHPKIRPSCDAGAAEDIIRAIWHICVALPHVGKCFTKAGATSYTLNMIESVIRGPKLAIAQPKAIMSKTMRRHFGAARERLVTMGFGLLYLLCSHSSALYESGGSSVSNLLLRVVTLAKYLIETPGLPRSLALLLMHKIMFQRSSGGGSSDPPTLWHFDGDTQLIDGLLKIAAKSSATEIRSTQSETSVWTSLQAVAILDLMRVPASTTHSKNETRSFAALVVYMIKSNDFVVCGHAVAILSCWSLEPKLKVLLLHLECGTLAVRMIQRAARELSNETGQNDMNNSHTRQVVRALCTSVRAVRNLAIHRQFQPAIGSQGIAALSFALTHLHDFGCHDAIEDAETALYCLGRHPANVQCAYRVHLKMQAARLRFEKEENIRRVLSVKSRSALVRRRLIQSGAVDSKSDVVEKEDATAEPAMKGGMWERRRRASADRNWIKRPLSAKHIISHDDKILMRNVVTLSSRMCRPTALMLSSVDPDPQKVRFRYSDPWRPNIKEIAYKSSSVPEPLPQNPSKRSSHDSDANLITSVRKKLSNAIMTAEKYTQPWRNNARPVTAPSMRGRRRQSDKRISRYSQPGKHNAHSQRPRTAPGNRKKLDKKRRNLKSAASLARSSKGTPMHPHTASMAPKHSQQFMDHDNLASGHDSVEQCSSVRPITDPPGKGKNLKKLTPSLRPSTARSASRPRKRTNLNDGPNARLLRCLDFSMKLEERVNVRFRGLQRRHALSKRDADSQHLYLNYDEDIVAARFAALPDTSTAADVDLPTYELPDGRFTHYFVKTDKQFALEGMSGVVPPEVSSDLEFPGIHKAFGIAPLTISLEPATESSELLEYRILSQERLKRDRMHAAFKHAVASGQTHSNFNPPVPSSRHHTFKWHHTKTMLDASDELACIIKPEEPNVEGSEFVYKPDSVHFDILLKKMGCKMKTYKREVAAPAPWNIYMSRYAGRICDPLSEQYHLCGSDELAAEQGIATDWKLGRTFHPEVTQIPVLADNNAYHSSEKLETLVEMDSRALEDLRCCVVRHATFLSELYVLFHTGCDSLFRHRWTQGRMYTSVICMEKTFNSICPHNKVSRSSFVAGLIKAAMSEHVPTLQHGIFDDGRDNVTISVDVGGYFERLVEHLRQKHTSTFSKLMRRNHRVFRWKHLYVESTMAAIHEEHSKLHTLFSFFADDVTERLSLESWLAFTSITQIQSKNVDHDMDGVRVSLLFRWSCHNGDATMDFSGWCELMARLSVRVALPTEDETASVRNSAFLWLEGLRKQGKLRQWENDHRVNWAHKVDPGKVAQVLPRFLDYVDRKLRVARNIQHFLVKRFRKWN